MKRWHWRAANCLARAEFAMVLPAGHKEILRLFALVGF
jgi:hypothetical protein